MTAVEWLAEKLRIEFGFAFSNNILEQAKEMEKEWQTERMYSEEEVLKLLITFSDDRTFLKKDVAIKWFEQFKEQAK